MGFRVPPPLCPGSVVAVVAPSGPFDRDELFRGLAWLRTRYQLRLTPGVLAREGYLAGTDARRAAELAEAFERPEVAAIVAARGGYGSMRIIDALPWKSFDTRPKWIVGFSDITALHIVANARGIASIHAPNVTGLGRTITAAERQSLILALECPTKCARATWSGLRVLVDGSAEGPVVGGNLAMVVAMAAAGRLVVPEGAVLVLEDVTERPYRVDRMLTSLILAGVFSRVSGVVFGGFTQCEPASDGVTVEDVLAERTLGLGIPVVSGAPFGHGAPNCSFVLGQVARLSGDTLAFQSV